ncbi:hypothetical protein MMC17_001432 [Xylographa soralifera]|nr:hypothetical protein [Xylographa soralifera]
MASRRFLLAILLLSAVLSSVHAASSTTSTSTSVPTITSTQIAAFNLPSTDFNAFCWYPLSGNYGRLPRILFYITLVFALLARTHQWLIAGALAAALTYSGTAAIHACMLIWRGPTNGETDYWALLAILSTSCILTVPLINWSSTLRTLGAKRDKYDSASRTIIIYWGFLVAVGFLCCFVAIWDNHINLPIFNYSAVDTVTCVPPGGKMNYTVGQNPEWKILIVDEEFVQTNNCLDPCSGAQIDPYNYFPIPGGAAIFRNPGDSQILTMAEIDYLADVGISKSQSRNLHFVEFYIQWGLLVLPYILVQGIYAAFFGRKAPREVRDMLYFYFKVRPIPYFTSAWAKQRSATAYVRAKRIQRWLSQFFCLTMYLWAIFVTMLCAPLLVANVVASEIALDHVAQSETAIHIGAWAPWAAAGLVIFAAGVARFQIAIVIHAGEMFKELAEWVGHVFRVLKRRLRASRYQPHADSEKASRPGLKDSRSHSEAPFPQIVRKTGWSAFETLGGPLNRSRDRTNVTFNMIEKEWFCFWQFCKNPDEMGDFNPHWRTDNYKIWKERHPSHKDVLELGRSTISQNSSQNSKDNIHLTGSYDGGHIASSIAPRQPPPTRDRSNPSSAPYTRHQPILPLTKLTFSDHHDTDIADYTTGSRPKLQSKHLSLEKELPTLPPPTPNNRSPAATLKRPTTAPDDEEAHHLLNYSTQDYEPHATPANTGLKHSLRDSMTSRKRRSEAYTPSFELSPHSTYPHPPPHTVSAPVQQQASKSLTPRTHYEPPTPSPLFSEPEMQHLLSGSQGASSPPQPAQAPTGLSSEPPVRASAPQPGRASTVSYLQVQRPATRLFGNEIRLRKDEYGTYHLVEEGEEAGRPVVVEQARGMSWYDGEGD